MITYFIDLIYGLSIVGMLAGIALVADGLRRLKEKTISTKPLGQSRPRMTWIYSQKPRV